METILYDNIQSSSVAIFWISQHHITSYFEHSSSDYQVELLKENVEEDFEEGSPGNEEEETMAGAQEMDCSTLRWKLPWKHWQLRGILDCQQKICLCNALTGPPFKHKMKAPIFHMFSSLGITSAYNLLEHEQAMATENVFVLFFVLVVYAYLYVCHTCINM